MSSGVAGDENLKGSGSIALRVSPGARSHRVADRQRVVPYHDLRRVRKNNVRYMYWHVFTFTMYQSVCQWNLFDAYLSILAREKGFARTNTWVGFAEGISGVTTLVLALPIGFLVDTYSRVNLLKYTAGVGLVATCVSAYAFTFDDLPTLYSNLVLWGIFTGFQGTAAEAVFTDSIEKGKRSEMFTYRGILNTAGLSLGPILMLGLFFFIGDNWTLSLLHVPLLVGCQFAPLSLIPLLLMEDPMPNNAEHINHHGGAGGVGLAAPSSLRTPLLSVPTSLNNPTGSPTLLLRRDRIGSALSDFTDLDDHTISTPTAAFPSSAQCCYGHSVVDGFNTAAGNANNVGGGMRSNSNSAASASSALSNHDTYLKRNGGSNNGGTVPAASGALPSQHRIKAKAPSLSSSDFLGHSSYEDAEAARFENMGPGERLIPYILTVADFITEIGAGMTVRFFPLFFINDYKVSPIGLCSIFAVYPLCIAIAMPICQRLSKPLGRAQASFIFQCLGILMLVLMTRISSLPLLVVVFMLRGQLQNAAYPVDRSILMDWIPSKTRGRWNSIASLTTMTWSGSAVLGGLLADGHDYRFTFLITALIYVLGVAAYTPLLWLVPRRELPQSPVSGRAARRAAAAASYSQHLMDTMDEHATTLPEDAYHLIVEGNEDRGTNNVNGGSGGNQQQQQFTQQIIDTTTDGGNNNNNNVDAILTSPGSAMSSTGSPISSAISPQHHQQSPSTSRGLGEECSNTKSDRGAPDGDKSDKLLETLLPPAAAISANVTSNLITPYSPTTQTTPVVGELKSPLAQEANNRQVLSSSLPTSAQTTPSHSHQSSLTTTTAASAALDHSPTSQILAAEITTTTTSTITEPSATTPSDPLCPPTSSSSLGSPLSSSISSETPPLLPNGSKVMSAETVLPPTSAPSQNQSNGTTTITTTPCLQQEMKNNNNNTTSTLTNFFETEASSKTTTAPTFSSSSSFPSPPATMG